MEWIPQFKDSDIVLALKNGKKDRDNAILALYRNYYVLLRNFILNSGGNEQDAEDIFQETMVAFIDLVKNDKYRQEASIKTMLYTINRNIWYTEVTKRKKTETRNRIYVADQVVEDKNMDTYISERESRSELMEIIEKLGSQCKQILLLFYYENLNMKEILEHTKFETEQVVRNKKYKCLKQLEALLKEDKNLYIKLKNLLHHVQ